MRIAIVGGGIFGGTAALELQRRGHEVTLVDPGPLPHPDAASTDISKIVRLDYGGDAFYTEIMERALPRWRELNATWPRPLFHETGFLLLSSRPLADGGFELESLRTLSARGHQVERLDGAAIARRFPMWSTGRYVDGYYNPQGGWAESGRVSAWYAEAARGAGATLRVGDKLAALAESDRGVEGVVLEDGRRIDADLVVVAAGAWTPVLVPELAPSLTPIGQPVLHFRPAAATFGPPAFVPWAAEIAETGWYGFCANADGIVKVANHGRGIPIDPRSTRVVPAPWEHRCRAFFRTALPSLAEAPLVGTRLCLYCDSFDGDLWITRHPERAGLVIAAGGSGHGFKFAPVLGEMIADACEGREGPEARRFGWRAPDHARFEEARFTG